MPSKRLLRKLNAETLPDEATLQPILTIGDPHYYQQRSRELILESETLLRTPNQKILAQADHKLRTAMKLLLLARAALAQASSENTNSGTSRRAAKTPPASSASIADKPNP